MFKRLSSTDKTLMTAFSYYCVALWQAGVGIYSERYVEYSTDTAIWSIIGLLTQFLRNRVVSALIFLLVLLRAVLTFLLLFYSFPGEIPNAPGDIGNHPGMIFVLALFAYRSMRATFKYRKEKRTIS
jgi:peptidoglycan/LPS O-acetylase OafA/YrhL